MAVPLILRSGMSGTLMLHRAYIALGSNVGDRAANLTAAIAMLTARDDVRVARVATPIETMPVDCPPGSPTFLNTAAELVTSLAPLDLLDALQAIERDLGRQRSLRNAPRLIDLDLLLYDDRVLSGPRLTLPHPRMHERRFVLDPLASIAPDVIHPALRLSIRALRDALPA